MFNVGHGRGCTRYWVLGESLVADVTRKREFTGHFGNRGRRLPGFVLYLRDLIGKDCGSVDEWGARSQTWRDVGLMSHDRGLPTGFLSMDYGTACFGYGSGNSVFAAKAAKKIDRLAQMRTSTPKSTYISLETY